MSQGDTTAVDGHLDIDYRNVTGWGEDAGSPVLPVLVGDETCGPMLLLSSTAPVDEPLPPGYDHGHATDSWRISVRGTTQMGRQHYGQGQWRFHEGGIPYASDNYAWGPEGGFGLIIFMDRRGFAIRPLDVEIAAKIIPEAEFMAEVLGIELLNPLPGAPAIVTTMGEPEDAHLNGGFDRSSEWDEVVPGIRMAVGLAGEPTCGPVLLFLDAAPGAELLPSRCLAAETVLIPSGGTTLSGDDSLAEGVLRLEEADTEHPALVAGEDGAQIVVFLSDRRAVRAALDGGSLTGPVAEALSDRLAPLQHRLDVREPVVGRKLPEAPVG